MLLVVAGWALFAFAGVYTWTLVPLAIVTCALMAIARPAIARGAARTVDLALIASAAAIAVQLVPLPLSIRQPIAPANAAYARAVPIPPLGTTPSGIAPISVDPGATWLALASVVLVLGVYWSARTLLARGGARATVRGIAVMGLIVTPVALAQHLTAPRDFFWQWPGPSSNTLPYSPFVNRNDFAGWLAMALLLTIGYAVGRLHARGTFADEAGGRSFRFDPDTALDRTGVMLTTSALAMTAGLFASLSRSGMLAGAAGLATFVALARRRMNRRQTGVLVAGVVGLAAAAAAFTNAGLFAERLSNAVSEGVAGRLSIWRQTWPMVREFWPLGSGVGSYQRVMVLYQTSSRLFYISHADNEYLQIAAEGGAPLAAAVAVAIAAAFTLVRRQLAADRSSYFWMRAGAAAALVGLAVQNVWEMTLRVPANAVLLAIASAIAMRDARGD